MSLPLLDQPTGIQIEILRKLPIETFLQVCQSNRYFRDLCHDSPQLDDRFQEVILKTFGIREKIDRTWYLTLLTIQNDVRNTVNTLTPLISVHIRKYINIDILKEDLSSLFIRLLKDILDNLYDAEKEFPPNELIVTKETMYDFIPANEISDISLSIMIDPLKE